MPLLQCFISRNVERECSLYFPPSYFIDAEIDRDAVEPGVKRRIKLKLLYGFEYPNEYFLSKVLNRSTISKGQVDNAGNLSLILPYQFLKRSLIAGLGSANELEIGFVLFQFFQE